MKRVLLFILCVFTLTGCSNSIEGTKWVSKDYSDGELIMEKEILFDKNEYTLTIKNLVYDDDITITKGRYTFEDNNVAFIDENISATIVNDTLRLNEDVDGDGINSITFVKHRP
jgi:hypothetical protein